ncbi:histidine phosphatase family protein [Paenibacillus ihbetae]|uniref:Histidine phosphatase family protein n=1 Tax=Paenibacillus ihbetae TaxID=1870820 RepID=A0A1B2DXX5_9BACL|nr:histidine phosphatase family protein [Paenibacillus ihbetae]ANY72563.1 phosphoglycerate mutase [Paenibacillus ihbetae]OOC58467.1 histidine phosphatase family protein [Paenibacillus ihbetae]
MVQLRNIYVVRHCQAEGQAPDAGLTITGMLQAARLAEFLSDQAIDRVVSSPYVRARQSIAPLAERLGLEVTLDERLTERILSASPSPDWREKLLLTYEDMDLCYEGGESSSAAMERAFQAVEDILHQDCRNAVLVSHGNLISLLLKYYDHRIGFKEWEALTNPDVYRLSFPSDGGSPSLLRVWPG